MQGRLRNKSLSVTVNTACAHCARPMVIEIDSDLRYRVKEEDCQPMIFVPDVDLLGLEDDSIIQAF